MEFYLLAVVDIDGKYNMVHIAHYPTRIKQGDNPICGICAFLNGFYNDNSDPSEWDDLLNKLWIYSIDKNIPNNISLLSANNVSHYSFVGEFFSSNNLKNFLTYISQNNISVGSQNINVKQKLSKLIGHPITEIDIDDVKKIEWDKFLNEENTFYLIPINSFPIYSWVNYIDKHKVIKCINKYKLIKWNDQYNMHWICLKRVEKKPNPYIFNSAGNRYGERNAIKHAIKDDGDSINKLHKWIGGISNSNILDDVITNMQERSKYVPFDFKEWVKTYKNQKFIDERKERIDRINQSKECKYSFVDSEFKIIKVTYIIDKNSNLL